MMNATDIAYEKEKAPIMYFKAVSRNSLQFGRQSRDVLS